MTEMFPRPTEYLQPQKSSAWLEKAKQLAIVSEKKVEAFNFRPESCVKLNNVESARKLLDNMYNQMEVDKIIDVLSASPPVPEKAENPRFLFTVKIVIAEDLVPLDSSPSALLDTFVTLSDEAGNRLVKTRTIYETLNPRCKDYNVCCRSYSDLTAGEETFDISVDKPLWLMCSIRDRALVGQHDVVGRGFICLNPAQYGDFLTHDVWLHLEAPNHNHQGRILLRVSMEGEKDDAQFYFGRGFRSLKRSEGDMMRIFIDKVSGWTLVRGGCTHRILLPTDVTVHKTVAVAHGIEEPRQDGYSSRLQQSACECNWPLPICTWLKLERSPSSSPIV